MPDLSQFATALALLGTGALLGGALYDAAVLAPNLRGAQAALEHGRLFMAADTPANLFRRLAPATQVLVLLAIAANWTNAQTRWTLAVAFVVLTLTDVITFKFHYPLNRLLFTAPLDEAPDRLALAENQWAKANLVRIVLVLTAWVFVVDVLI